MCHVCTLIVVQHALISGNSQRKLLALDCSNNIQPSIFLWDEISSLVVSEWILPPTYYHQAHYFTIFLLGKLKKIAFIINKFTISLFSTLFSTIKVSNQHINVTYGEIAWVATGVKLWLKSILANWAGSFQNLLTRKNFHRPILWSV